MQTLLEGVELRDPTRSLEAVSRLGAGVPERVAGRIQLALASVPDPDNSIRWRDRAASTGYCGRMTTKRASWSFCKRREPAGECRQRRNWHVSGGGSCCA